MASNSEIIHVLKMLEEYYSKPLSETAVLVYLRTLSDLDAAELEEGAFLYIKSGKQWFPKVNELREFVGKVGRRAHHGEGYPFWLAMDALAKSMRGEISCTELYRHHEPALLMAGFSRLDPMPTPAEQAEWDADEAVWAAYKQTEAGVLEDVAL